MATGLIGASYLLYVRRDLGFPEGWIGTIAAVGGVGALLGTWVAARAERAQRLGVAMAVAGFVRTAGIATLPMATNRDATGAGFLVANQAITDPAWQVQEVIEASTRQRNSPDELGGRVAAAHSLVGSTGRLVGMSLAWVIADSRTALWLSVVVAAVASIVLARSPVSRVRAPGQHDPAQPAGSMLPTP